MKRCAFALLSCVLLFVFLGCNTNKVDVCGAWEMNIDVVGVNEQAENSYAVLIFNDDGKGEYLVYAGENVLSSDAFEYSFNNNNLLIKTGDKKEYICEASVDNKTLIINYLKYDFEFTRK